MSTGNLADMYNQPNLLGNGMQGGLRGVASTSNIWDGQVIRLPHHREMCSCDWGCNCYLCCGLDTMWSV